MAVTAWNSLLRGTICLRSIFCSCLHSRPFHEHDQTRLATVCLCRQINVQCVRAQRMVKRRLWRVSAKILSKPSEQRGGLSGCVTSRANPEQIQRGPCKAKAVQRERQANSRSIPAEDYTDDVIPLLCTWRFLGQRTSRKKDGSKNSSDTPGGCGLKSVTWSSCRLPCLLATQPGTSFSEHF